MGLRVTARPAGQRDLNTGCLTAPPVLISMTALVTLKKRPEFLRVRGGRRYSSDAVLVEGKSRRPSETKAGEAKAAETKAGAPAAKPVSQDDPSGARFGFTITKKIGNAVTRNRIRRRLKAAVTDALRQVSDDIGKLDYVLVARRPAATKPYAELVEDIVRALQHINRPRPVRPRDRHQK